jgi:trans-aconitate 2-methyltransferase
VSVVAGPREWDASTYDRVNAPHREWAVPIIDRLELAGDETVLDAGCGSGSVTAMLAERLPQGRVIGVDGSADMIRVARENLGPNAELHEQDLLELSLDEKVDAVFSSATFHWVLDHELLFRRLAACMRPGARLSAQCGGKGNVAEIRLISAEVLSLDPFAEHFGVKGSDPGDGTVTAGWQEPYLFASPRETRERLAAAGFEDIEAWLEPKTTKLEPDKARDFIRTVCMNPYLGPLPEELHEPFTDAVIERLADPTELGYVRLNMTARRGEA